ncbi:hypothetical protein TNIN_281811 [Trichonephila inaurata madagascariensis]|uniref:Uncharacterized protein n=1 Tax=Trichonephila inaurata madagascariensis TaxID=2747483 RepID=A0A8X6YMF0_9ARAC|nr:hypothetical protein TNIN_281811 [Trichonephila inaurata madagascariensis]
MSPVTRFFKNGACSFRCSSSVKIRTRSALLSSESSWGNPSSDFPHFSKLFEATNDHGLFDIEVFSQHSYCQALVLFHGCQKSLIVEI